jgi:hypothetical protein
LTKQEKIYGKQNTHRLPGIIPQNKVKSGTKLRFAHFFVIYLRVFGDLYARKIDLPPIEKRIIDNPTNYVSLKNHFNFPLHYRGSIGENHFLP